MRAPNTELPLFNWTPPRKVVAFPLMRRLRLVARTARSVAYRGQASDGKNLTATGEKLLRAALKSQRSTMERRGIDPADIEAELKQFERVVRIAVAFLLAEDGAAA